MTDDGGADTISLQVEEKLLQCNKHMLCEHSDYFTAMFSSNMRESRESVIALKGVSLATLEPILAHCQTGSIDVNQDNAWQLLMTSQMLQFNDVFGLCQRFIINNLSVINCVSWMVNAQELSVTSVYNAARSFLLYHFHRLSKLASAEIYTLPTTEFRAIMSSDSLNVESEIQVLECVVTYIDKRAISDVTPGCHGDHNTHCTDNSKADVAALLDCIRFANIDKPALRDLLEDERMTRYSLIPRIKDTLDDKAVRQSPRLYPQSPIVCIDTVTSGTHLCKFVESDNRFEKICQVPIPNDCVGHEVSGIMPS